MVMGGGPEFPDVDPRFEVQPRHLFGPFWQLQVIDTVTSGKVNPQGGGFLTGYTSVRRAAKYSTEFYLDQLDRR